MVPETHGLSSPVRDSWESTHPCNDHLELESKNKISKKRVPDCGWITSGKPVGGVNWVPYCGGSTSGETGGIFHMPACVGRLALW